MIDFVSLAASGKLAQNAALLMPGSIGTVMNDKHVMEPKFDGWRILAVVTEDAVYLFARSGNQYVGKLPKVETELSTCPAGTVLDGEVVALVAGPGGVLLNDWGIVQSVMTKHGGSAVADKVSFMVFDLLAHAGIDARALTLSNRRKLLGQLFTPATSPNGQDTLAADRFKRVRLAPQVAATEANHDALVKAGFEGTVVKRLDTPYASGKRGEGWFKIKPQTTVEVVVTGFKEGKSGFKGLVGALVFGQHDADGNMVERGACSGMDMRTRLEITEHPEKWLGRVIEIAHMGVMKGTFRHPQFKRVRNDKTPAQVVLHDA